MSLSVQTSVRTGIQVPNGTWKDACNLENANLQKFSTPLDREPTNAPEIKYAFIDMSLFLSLTSQSYSKVKE